MLHKVPKLFGIVAAVFAVSVIGVTAYQSVNLQGQVYYGSSSSSSNSTTVAMPSSDGSSSFSSAASVISSFSSSDSWPDTGALSDEDVIPDYDFGSSSGYESSTDYSYGYGMTGGDGGSTGGTASSVYCGPGSKLCSPTTPPAEQCVDLDPPGDAAKAQQDAIGKLNTKVKSSCPDGMAVSCPDTVKCKPSGKSTGTSRLKVDQTKVTVKNITVNKKKKVRYCFPVLLYERQMEQKCVPK